MKNKKGKKPKKDSTIENVELLLDRYMHTDGEFWKLWGKNQMTLFFEHKHYKGFEMN